MSTVSKCVDRVKSLTPAIRIYGGVIFAIQVVMFLLYLSGGVTVFYGRPVTLSTALQMLFSISNVETAHYRAWFGFFLGGLYLGILAIIIKNLITSISFFKHLMFDKTEQTGEVVGGVLSLGTYTVNSFVRILLVIFSCGWADRFVLVPNAKIMIFLGIFVFLATRAMCCLLNDYTPLSVGLYTATWALFLLASMLLLVHTGVPVIPDFFRTFQVLVSSGNSQVASNLFSLAESVLYGVVGICVLCLLSYANKTRAIVKNAELRQKGKRLLTVSVLPAVAALAPFIVDGGNLDLGNIFAVCKPYLSLACAAAVCVSTYLGFDLVKQPRRTEGEAAEQPDENGRLIIPAGTTEIEAEAYQDRQDIRTIYIPESVTGVGKHMVHGCGAVTDIFCAAPCKPEGWDDEWNAECHATVHWGWPSSVSGEAVKSPDEVPAEGTEPTCDNNAAT